MPISWNEIRQNAIRFSREWAEETREDAEAKSFWDAFFGVFGIPRRSVATFEEPVRKLSGQYGFIDLFWKGRLLVEHKSRGKSLDQAESQAFDYLQSLARENRHDEIPRYVIVSDFDRLALFDLEPEDARDLPLFCGMHVQRVEIRVKDLHRHVQLFGFIPGYKVRSFAKEDPINIKAAEVMGELHDALAAGGYAGHNLERFLVRVLFCLFAEDTGLFPSGSFTEYLVNQTRPDGTDLGLHLAEIFQVLDTPVDKRQRDLDERLLALPYVNGGLFAETLPLARLNSAMRAALLRCTEFDWSRISPAVFGSLFQSILEPKARRQIGAHYTSERDILKVVRALFLDDLRAEFEGIRHDRRELLKFHGKLGKLKFFDPACGCGNFLVVTYRELRLLELDVLDALYQGREKEGFLEVTALSQFDVDQMGGIEIEEWPARIAETALWLMDHQMNLLLSERFGEYYARLPLRKTALIVNDNALRLNWKTILNPAECSYILGNPPFVGHQWRTEGQQSDMEAIWGGDGRFGRLDYVTCWYKKAAEFIQETSIRVGFVSTNSISQGEQVGILWSNLNALGVRIHFAHRTFPWQSEARGKAHVHVVIIGFGVCDVPVKRLYDYADGEDPTVSEVRGISPYLVEGGPLVLPSRTAPPTGMPQMKKGSQPTDGGHLVLTEKDRSELVGREPAAAKWLRPFIGGEELLNGGLRWCLWLKGIAPSELRNMPAVLERVAKVRESRLKSPTASVRQFADNPTVFTQDRQPDRDYLAVPEVSSETRRFIPIAFLSSSVIASNKLQIIVGGTLYHFGVLSSTMHMAWVRTVSGRLESRYSYAPAVYNNFPWPQADGGRPSAKSLPDDTDSAREPPRSYGSKYNDAWAALAQPTDILALQHDPPRLADATPKQAAVESAAQAVLNARAEFAGSTLADLYDPLTMPSDLVTAHAALDRAVDRCYRAQPFTSDRQRVEYLFALYERLAAPLLPTAVPKRGRGARTSSARADEVA
jgi:hypothetical protein